MPDKLYTLAGQFNIAIRDRLIIGRMNEVGLKNLGLLGAPAPKF